MSKKRKKRKPSLAEALEGAMHAARGMASDPAVNEAVDLYARLLRADFIHDVLNPRLGRVIRHLPEPVFVDYQYAAYVLDDAFAELRERASANGLFTP